MGKLWRVLFESDGYRLVRNYEGMATHQASRHRASGKRGGLKTTEGVYLDVLDQCVIWEPCIELEIYSG